MTDDHKRLIYYYEQQSKVRSFCNTSKELKDEYNSVLKEYIIFLMVHGQFVSNFIVQNLRAEEATGNYKPGMPVGTAGLSLKGIISRYH